MNSAKYVDDLIQEQKASGIPLTDVAWNVAKACIGWAYVFGAYGDYCDPSNRRSRYREAYPTIKSKCKNFNGRDTVPAGCVGCQWFLGTADSDESIHEGRTRFFDCRGFVYWILHKVYGFWDGCPAGATSMWNNDNNWSSKGTLAEGQPDTLVCLFYRDKDNPSKMAHVGFGYHGETIECSVGVEYHQTYNKKWTHWAVPKCVTDVPPVPGPAPDPDKRPTLRRGDKGEYVTLLQTKLVTRGYDLGSYGVDGSFGRATEAAVKSFQKDSGLSADGICGQKTWAALDETSPTLYSVMIPHLTRSRADELVKTYAGAVMTEEGR